MKFLIQSYPPLGQVTTVDATTVVLTSVLDVSRSREDEEWGVALWVSVDNGDWHEIRLSRLRHGAEPEMLSKKSELSSLLYFSCSLSIRKSAQFTLKVRQAVDKPWKWVRDEEGLSDGFILLPTSSASSSTDSRPCITDLNNEWKVSSHVSQSPGTQLWSLKCSLPASTGKESACRDVDIGIPWGSFLRWFALVRHKPSWLGPRQGKSHFSVDQDAILCCFLSHDGKTMALLAISGVGNVTATFRDNDHGVVAVHARNDSTSSETISVLVSEGIDFDHAVASVMYHARTLVSEACSMSQSQTNSQQQLDTKELAGWKYEWQDGQQLSEKRVLDAVEDLAKNEIHISNLIIDDNWQSLDRIGNDQSHYGWTEFEADRKAFPSGLKSVVAQIRSLHPGIQNIMVWHALLGYWGGISPNGPLAKTYDTIEVAQEGEGSPTLTVVGKADVSRFYNDFYGFLTEAGIDGVKADAQVMVDKLADAPDRRDLISTYLDAWSRASERHFGSKTISCMSQFPHALFCSQLPRSRREFFVRNSDDFFPDEPRSHPWHVWTNAHNAIFTQFLNAVPDWDMFQTAHPHAGFHAAARCVSGGPIFITDHPAAHSMHVVKQMTATTPAGRTIVLRPSVLGKSIHAYAGYEDDFLLKIGSYNGASQTGTGILGVFNISTRLLTEVIPLEYFPGVFKGGNYVVRAHTTGRMSKPMSIDAPESLIATSIDEAGYEILCAFPATAFESSRYGSGHVGVLGLVGTLGVYISTLPLLDIKEDFMVMIEGWPVRFETVRRSADDGRVFEIDVEKNWEEVAARSMQRGEAQVTVSFQP
ncbi:hypothetical protein ED733_006545 [Metarhizium rileyi]|uniref:Uncharacterized protein n=1 Tax=Metarhizium rileyi (strain RCEF 4871) TaxID=1649241 RepID=A0A5C6GC14_METRR|nr:hypothetical protein ED733_006545 [Metarhizium rileyi]